MRLSHLNFTAASLAVFASLQLHAPGQGQDIPDPASAPAATPPPIAPTEPEAGAAVEPLPPPNIMPPLPADPESLAPLSEPVMESLPPLDSYDDGLSAEPDPVSGPLLDTPTAVIPNLGGVERTGWRKHFFPYFRLGGFYDDNIFIQNTDRREDFVAFAGFGLRAGLGEVKAPLYTLREARKVPILYEAPPMPVGNYLLADYSGTFFRFTDTPSENSYDQDALLSMGWAGSKLSLGIEGRFQSLSGADIDVGSRVRRNIFYGGLSGKYELSEKSSLESGLAYTHTEYRDLINSAEWLNENWFNYQLTPKIIISSGISVGLLQIENSPDQPYGRILFRAKYEASAKLAFSGRIGVEYRDVEEGSPWRNNPVFSLGVTYLPFDGTELALQGYRLTEASAVRAGEDYVRTGIDLGIRQRFLQRFYFSVTGGYENLDYSGVETNVASNREDDYFFAKAAVAFDVTRWCNTEVFYNFQRDSSSLASQSFTNNQVGIEFNFAF